MADEKKKNNDLALARIPLPEGTIDLAIGEPTVIKNNLIKILKLSGIEVIFDTKDIINYTYPPAEGITDLVDFLRTKHNNEYVVVTNGAKQSLSAAIYALKSKKSNKIYVPKPYWLSFSALINEANCKMIHDKDKANILLLTAPNNPDGSIEQLSESRDRPTIFDGAYYSEQYLPKGFKLERIGDIQLYSYSKMYGLSGLRVGYAVTSDEELANKMREYVESTTMGVSVISQEAVLKLEKAFAYNPSQKEFFMDSCRRDLERNRQKLRSLDKSILDISKIQETGMFAFLPKGENFDKAIKEAKIRVIDGEFFGMKNYSRITLSLEYKIFSEAIDRLNNSVL